MYLSLDSSSQGLRHVRSLPTNTWKSHPDPSQQLQFSMPPHEGREQVYNKCSTCKWVGWYMHSPNSSARVILQGGGEGRNTNHTLTHGSVTSRDKCHRHLCSKSRTPTAAPQRLVQYVLMEQPRIRGKCTSIDISSRTNWVRKAEARISNARAEAAVMQGKQIPSFKAVWGQKSFALQSLHVIRTEAEYLCFIRVK